LVEEANKIQKSVESDHLLHLKSCCSMIGPKHMAVGGMTGSVLAKYLTTDFHQLLTVSDQSVATAKKPFIQPRHIVHLPDRDAANCLWIDNPLLWINNTLIHRSSKEFPKSAAILKEFCEQQGMQRVEIEYDEFAKVDGALTCCSLLF